MMTSMRKAAISVALQATRKKSILMENHEVGKVGLGRIRVEWSACQHGNSGPLSLA